MENHLKIQINNTLIQTDEISRKRRESPINYLVHNKSFSKKESQSFVNEPWKGFLPSSIHIKKLKESS